MKWLIIQSAGQHYGQDSWTPNHYLRECWSLAKAIIDVYPFVTVDVWGLRHPNFSQVPDFDSYDIIIVAENYEMDWLPDLSNVTRPKKWHWVIDLHVQGPKPYVPISRQCDYVLHATKGLIDSYRLQAPSQQHYWFPNAYDDDYFDCAKTPDVPRNMDVIFVGGRGTRAALLDTLKVEVGLQEFYGVTGWDYIAMLRKAKIQFNAPMAGDVNYRNFETIAMGACLLTAYDECLVELGFRDGVNCLMYSTPQAAVAKAREALATGAWADIGRAGYQLSKWHTYGHRVKIFSSHSAWPKFLST